MATMIFESVLIMVFSYSIVGIGGVVLLGKVETIAEKERH